MIGEFSTANDDYLRASITQLVVAAKKNDIKLKLLNLILHNQFGDSTYGDACMPLNTFSEICDMMHIKVGDPNAVKIRLFPFSLKRKAKNGCYLYLEAPDSWDGYCNTF
jgi:hypothetical protein